MGHPGTGREGKRALRLGYRDGTGQAVEEGAGIGWMWVVEDENQDRRQTGRLGTSWGAQKSRSGGGAMAVRTEGQCLGQQKEGRRRLGTRGQLWYRAQSRQPNEDRRPHLLAPLLPGLPPALWAGGSC